MRRNRAAGKARMLQIFFHRGPWSRARSAPWNSTAPVREELFGIERLEQHAESLAAAQQVTARPPVVMTSAARSERQRRCLTGSLSRQRRGARKRPRRRARGGMAARQLSPGRRADPRNPRRPAAGLLPAASQARRRTVRRIPARFRHRLGLRRPHRQPFRPGDAAAVRLAYQRVQPLTIGELWAVAITLRIVLVENLRRLADQIVGRAACAHRCGCAGGPAARASAAARSALDADIARVRRGVPVRKCFAAQLAKRLRDQDPQDHARAWLAGRAAAAQGTSIEEVVQHAQQRQGASNVTVRNIITSMRLISDIDWAELFESVSLVDERLRGSALRRHGFPHPQPLPQRHRSSWRAARALRTGDRARLSCRSSAPRKPTSAKAERVGDPGFHLIAEGRRALERAIGFRPPCALRSAPAACASASPAMSGRSCWSRSALLAARRCGRLAARRATPAGWSLIAAGRIPSRDGRRDRAGQPRDQLELPARSPLPGLDLREGVPPIVAHAGRGADAADQREPICWSRSSGSRCIIFRRRRRSLLSRC